MASPQRLRLVAPLEERVVEVALPHRNPVAADRPQLAELMLNAYRGTIDDDGETLEDAVNEVSSFYAGQSGVPLLECSYLAVDQGQPVAASLITLHDGEPLAAYVYTAPAWKNRGLASGLLQLSINALAGRGYHTLALWVTRGNTPAEHVYQKLGFRVGKRRDSGSHPVGSVTEVLLLDVDGVLQFPRAGFLEAIERDYTWNGGYLAFQHELFRDAEYHQTLTGTGDFLAVAARILPRHVDGLTAPVFLDRWLNENIELNNVLIELILRLSVQRVYLASNQEPRRGAHIERLYSGYGWLSGAFLSYRVGHHKPSQDFFEHVLQSIGRPAEACLFIDDAELCVTAASNAGIPSLRFLDTEQCASDLAERGLLLLS